MTFLILPTLTNHPNIGSGVTTMRSFVFSLPIGAPVKSSSSTASP